MQKFTVGQVSKTVQLSTKTIRFYEEAGVISPAERGDNGYRLYSSNTVEELTLIKSARDLGLPLSEIKKLLVGCEQEVCHETSQHLTHSIDNYISQLVAKINQFTVLKTKLEKLKQRVCNDPKNCDGSEHCCNMLSQLALVE